MRHVTLVCGPPCAGKSTYVAQHVQRGDLVVCFDHLAQQAGSTHPHEHQPQHRQAAARAYAALLAQVADMQDGRAWVIRCAPHHADRAALAARLHADAVVQLVPEQAEALARAELDKRSPRTRQAIRQWYQQHEAGHVETQAVYTSRRW